MALGKRLINTGAAAAVCNTDSVQAFGADAAFSSNIALYQLDGDGGVTNNVPDTTGNYNGTASNVTYSSGKFGNAAVFNGSSSGIFLTTSGNSVLDYDNDFSVSMWFKATSLNANSAYNNLWTAGGTRIIPMQVSISSGVLFAPYDGSNNVVSTGSGSISLNQWYNVVATRSKTSGLKIYLNGVLKDTDSFTGNASSLSQRDTIGQYWDGTRNSFAGHIDQVRLFDKAISAEDVATLYAETTSTASDTNPLSEGSGVALYTMDYDASDAGGYYDGTPTNVDFGVEGKINYGARFNGSSSYVALSGNPINGLSNISLSFWIKPEDVSSNQYIITFINSDGGWNGFGVRISSSAKIQIVRANSGTVTASENSTASISTGVLKHIAVTSSQSELKIYIDGSLDSTHSISGFTTNNTGEYNLGALKDAGSYSQFYDGDLDQVRVFSKALNQTEVDTLYAETACVYTATTTDNDYPTTNLAYYKLDNSAEDEKGSYDGTESNIEYRFGRFGQAAVFNGSSSIISIPQPTLSGGFTLSAWFKTTSSAFQSIITMGGSSTAAGLNIFTNSGNVITSFGNGSSEDYNAPTSSVTVNTGVWFHVALSTSGLSSGSTVKLYINGQLDDSESSSVSINTTSYTSAFSIGGRNLSGSLSTYFDGDIDQVRIYGAALTDSQVTDLYNEKPEVDTSNFKAVLYEGNGSTQYISNVGMDLETDGGLVWLKSRDTAYHHRLFDSVRGLSTDGVLFSNRTAAAEDLPSATDNFTSFDKNGFTLGSTSSTNGSNFNNDSYVAWVWKGGGDAVTNNDGTITSQVSANTAAGFSIVKWTGTGVDGKTIGHGLTSASPEIIFTKGLTNATSWVVGVGGISGLGVNDYLVLNSTSQKSSSTTFYQAYSTNTFQVGVSAANEMNKSASNDYISYCFHSVAGYSKIGSYTGDGTTSGHIIYTTDNGQSNGSNGFEPSFLLTKPTGPSGGYWYILDNRRSTTNPRNDGLFPNDNLAEIESSNYNVDFLSNGFELKNNTTGFNVNNENYIFLAIK